MLKLGANFHLKIGMLTSISSMTNQARAVPFKCIVMGTGKKDNRFGRCSLDLFQLMLRPKFKMQGFGAGGLCLSFLNPLPININGVACLSIYDVISMQRIDRAPYCFIDSLIL